MVTLVDPKLNEKIDPSRIIDGIIVRNAEKPDFGSIAFREQHITFGNGFTNTQPRVHFESGKIEDLQILVKSQGFQAGGQYNYKILVKESVTPYYEGQDPKINPTTLEIMKHKGQDIYRKTALVPTHSTECDELLTNDKVSVAGEVKASTTASKTETFKN